MESALAALINAALAGGNSAIVALLVLICYFFWVDRGRLVDQHAASERRLDAVEAAQMRGTQAIVDAINRLHERSGER